VSQRLFSDISADQAQEGKTDYRCIYVSNASNEGTLYGAKVYILYKETSDVTVNLGFVARNEVQQIIISKVKSICSGTFKIIYTDTYLGNIRQQVTSEIDLFTEAGEAKSIEEISSSIKEKLSELNGLETVNSIDSISVGGSQDVGEEQNVVNENSQTNSGSSSISEFTLRHSPITSNSISGTIYLNSNPIQTFVMQESGTSGECGINYNLIFTSIGSQAIKATSGTINLTSGNLTLNWNNSSPGVNYVRTNYTYKNTTFTFNITFQGQVGNRFNDELAVSDVNLDSIESPTIQTYRLFSGGPVNTEADIIDVETTTPNGVEFCRNTSCSSEGYDNAFYLGDLHPLDVAPIWIERIAPADSNAIENDGFTLKIDGTTSR
jgi:hypothetical protein